MPKYPPRKMPEQKAFARRNIARRRLFRLQYGGRIQTLYRNFPYEEVASRESRVAQLVRLGNRKVRKENQTSDVKYLQEYLESARFAREEIDKAQDSFRRAFGYEDQELAIAKEELEMEEKKNWSSARPNE